MNDSDPGGPGLFGALWEERWWVAMLLAEACAFLVVFLAFR